MRTTTILSALLLAACGGEPAVFGLASPATGGGDVGGSSSTTTGPGGQGGQGGASTATTGPGGQGGDLPCALGQLSCEGDELVVCDELGGLELVEDCGASGATCVVDACEQSLELRLRFEEDGGSQLVDDAQGLVGQLGGITGSTTWVPGHAGLGLDFIPSAEGDFGDVLNDLSFPVTITAWVYVDPSATMNMVFVATDASPTTGYAGFWLAVDPAAGNAVSVGFGNGLGTGPNNRNGKKTFDGFPSGEWTHVAAAVYGPQMAAIWIDGVFADGSYSGGAATLGFTAGHLVVGRAPWGASDLAFNGAIDDLRIYDRALTPGEVAALAAAK